MTGFFKLQHAFVTATALMIAACGGNSSPASSEASSAQGDAIARVGDISVRASPIQTAMLEPAIAQQYGITRADNTILLLVAVRQGPEVNERSLPAIITASATDLRGNKQAIVMREVRTGELLDYIGTVETSLPETLRFDVKAVRDGKAVATLQFNREFYPR
ncbi:MAG: DUF4426 domain-containing protein [Pseudomonadota bacterium]|nr:DUF4426 domain-containing protein [Pseudomonadota bacterium]MDQ3229665.1 DUF4426 domain-containing protein [Pseudomonadota bacterium]